MKVINSKNLPMKMPLEISLIFLLSVQINNYKTWSLITGIILITIAWVCYFLSFIIEKQVNIFKKKKVKPIVKESLGVSKAFESLSKTISKKIEFDIEIFPKKQAISFADFLWKYEFDRIEKEHKERNEMNEILKNSWKMRPYEIFSKSKRIDFVFSKLNPEE